MNRSRTNILSIKTPEGVEFSLQIAGPISRFLAWIIDGLVILVATSTIYKVLGILGIISRDLAFALITLAYFSVTIGYSIVTEWYFNGQTIGKRLFKLRVVDEQGLNLQFSQIVIRNLLRFIDKLPLFYLVGGISCLINGKMQRLGDLAANTIVIWNPRISEPDLDQLLEGKYNSFSDYPHLEARLRQHVSPQEAGISLQALIRRDEFDADARVELFHEIVSHFKNIVTFPQEATDGISDEQYVRNVVDTLYRSGTGRS